MTRHQILSWLLAVAATSTSAFPAHAETALEKGVRQYNARQYTEAISSLQVAVQQDGRNPAPHYNLGNAFMQTGDKIRAAREYEMGYSLSRTGPIADYCRSALAGIRQQGARAGVQSVTVYKGPYTGQRSNVHCPVGTESHNDGGVQRVGHGLSPQEWAIWRDYFDNAFRKIEGRIFARMVPNLENYSGICELYYSVDRNRHLRARVNRSTTDDSVNAACLEVVRALDGSPDLNFPAGLHVDEFNYYHGVILSELIMAMKRDGYSTNTSATLTSTNANLRPTGMTGVQLRLTPTTTNVDATMRTSDVNGKIISKNNKQKELKATQLTLPPDLASQEVKGQLYTDPAQKNVDGQLLTDPAQKNVDGQLLKDPAQKSVDGQLLKDPAQKSVDGQLVNDPAQKKVDGQLVDPQAPGQLADPPKTTEGVKSPSSDLASDKDATKEKDVTKDEAAAKVSPK